ncbi:MAG: MarR family winged helix-turn-helix transcriptional regulator [Gaiellaceae bacterium]
MARAKPPTEPDFERAAALREALRRFQRRTDDVTATHDITARAYQLLLMIKTARGGNGLASLAELEDRLQLGKSTVTELVLRSEKRGFVRRDLDRNRPGAITVALTPAGERRLERVTAELGDERRRLVEILSKLR